jgi:hypothetical protein
MVPVVQREWAAMNPKVAFETPITVDDVLNSRMIAYPFRLLQCCLVTDGGVALILVAAARPRIPAKACPWQRTGAGLPPRHRRKRRDADVQHHRHSCEKQESRSPEGFRGCPGPPLLRGRRNNHRFRARSASPAPPPCRGQYHT